MTEFWARADLEEAAFRGDELRRLGLVTDGRLATPGVFQRGEDLSEVECDACGDRHIEHVQIVIAPPGSKPRMYIMCKEAGRVQVEPERLEVQRIDFDGLARTAAKVLGLGTPRAIVENRLWLLDTARFGRRTRDVFLARGATWPDGRSLADHPRLATSPCPLILVPNLLPEDPIWTDGRRILMSMSEFNWFGDDSHAVLSRITAILAEHEAPEAETAQPKRQRTKTSGVTENTTGSQQAPSRHRERLARVERNFGCAGKPRFTEFYKRLGVTNPEFCAWKREDRRHCGRVKQQRLNQAADKLR